MHKAPHILIVAGDLSADQHGAALVDALRKQCPGVRISTLGGAGLQSKADSFLYPLVGLGGFGFWEPWLKLPQFWTALKVIKTLLKNDPPDLVVPMDYYGFNIRVARLAHSKSIPVVYYISPQVWATRPHRVRHLAASIQKMLVLFPFEEQIYRQAGVPVTFVGHPLLERMPDPSNESEVPTIGLLPGSRRGTATRHLPLLVQTAELLRKEFPSAHCFLFRPEEIEPEFYRPFLAQAPWIELTADPIYENRKHLWVALGVSGTAALENMLLGIPMVIMYKLSRLTFWIAKRLIQVAYIGIPNLLAKRTVVSEFLQNDATPQRLSQAVGELLHDRAKRNEMRRELLALRTNLQGGGSAKAAQELLEVIGVQR